MPDFLLELLTEEIPARMQSRAAEQLRERFEAGIKGQLPCDAVRTLVTPRRLILIATGLAAEGSAQEEERRGPRADAPAQALEGFLRSTGLTRDQLEARETPKGTFLYATIRTPGRSAADVIAELVPQIVREFDWPKSMRWGDASASTASPRWVRPLSSIVALLDGEVVPFEAAGIASGRTTRGHRFMAREAIEIASVATYADQLRAAKVLVDPAERATIIVEGARAAATARGLTLIEDDGLVRENAGLTEWPVPLLGAFDPAFLEVPREVIQLTMRTNQKYFACVDASGALAPAFVCVANLDAPDGGETIVAGNQKVLAARLSDAKFFWDQDRAVTLESRLPKLASIVFHEKLGTVADKVERVAKLARWLVESGAVGSPSPAGRVGETLRSSGPGVGSELGAPFPPPGPAQERRLSAPLPSGEGEALADLAEQAARLCKADLVSATVGEFPEVQGIAGRYLALGEGLDPQVADAIRDHYKPVGQGDDVPTAPVSVAVALADKLDTLFAFFEIEEFPTGSKDPFALRRAMLGVVRILFANKLRLHLGSVAEAWLQQDRPRELDQSEVARRKIITTVTEFALDRLAVQQRDEGVPPDLVAASRDWSSAGDGRLDRVVARAGALKSFLGSDDGTNLLAGYRRAANILKIEEGKDGPHDGAVDPALLAEPAEQALAAALDAALPAAAAAVAREAFEDAMTVLASLRPPVDAFFDAVMVNAPDPALRANRLRLLASFRAAVHTVADFSRIEG